MNKAKYHPNDGLQQTKHSFSNKQIIKGGNLYSQKIKKRRSKSQSTNQTRSHLQYLIESNKENDSQQQQNMMICCQNQSQKANKKFSQSDKKDRPLSNKQSFINNKNNPEQQQETIKSINNLQKYTNANKNINEKSISINSNKYKSRNQRFSVKDAILLLHMKKGGALPQAQNYSSVQPIKTQANSREYSIGASSISSNENGQQQRMKLQNLVGKQGVIIPKLQTNLLHQQPCETDRASARSSLQQTPPYNQYHNFNKNVSQQQLNITLKKNIPDQYNMQTQQIRQNCLQNESLQIQQLQIKLQESQAHLSEEREKREVLQKQYEARQRDNQLMADNFFQSFAVARKKIADLEEEISIANQNNVQKQKFNLAQNQNMFETYGQQEQEQLQFRVIYEQFLNIFEIQTSFNKQLEQNFFLLQKLINDSQIQNDQILDLNKMKKCGDQSLQLLNNMIQEIKAYSNLQQVKVFAEIMHRQKQSQSKQKQPINQNQTAETVKIIRSPSYGDAPQFQIQEIQQESQLSQTSTLAQASINSIYSQSHEEACNYNQNTQKILQDDNLSRQKVNNTEWIQKGVENQKSIPNESQAIAIRQYTPQNENEIEFNKGDSITILKKTNNDWWIGLCNNKIGYFPRTYAII